MANMAKIENCTHPASKAKIDAIRAFLHQETKENGYEKVICRSWELKRVVYFNVSL